MPDLNDFYEFKTTTSGGDSSGGKRSNSNNCNSSSNGCSTALIVLAFIGWVLWFVGKFVG